MQIGRLHFSVKAYVGDNTAEAVFVPTAENPTIEIVVNNGDETKTYTVTVSVPEGGFQSGCCYTMEVQIGADKVITGTFSATGWTAAEGGDLATE